MRFLLLVLLTSTLVSCQQRTILSCEELEGLLLTNVDFDGVTTQGFEQWVRSRQVVTGDVSIQPPERHSDVVADASWESGIGDYQANLDGERLVSLQLRLPNESSPTAEQVVDCLGAPDSYRALYLYNQYELLLHYPDKGIIVEGATATMFNRPPSDLRRIPMYDFNFVRPGALEQVLRDMHSNPRVGERILELTLPWTGEWERIIHHSE